MADDFNLDMLVGDSLFPGGVSDGAARNGTPYGGGNHFHDVLAPQTPSQAQASTQLDPTGALNPKYSPLGALLAIVAGVLALNYVQNRKGRKG